MNNTQTTTVREALSQIVNFWQMLLAGIGVRRALIASGLTLLAGVTEGLGLILLVPLLQSIDPAAASGTALPGITRALQSLGLELRLSGVLILFVCVALVRSVLNLQANIYVTATRLSFIRNLRIELYSAIAHAKWSFLRARRPADLLSALTVEADRLDAAVFFALELPRRVVMTVAHFTAAFLISPLLSCSAALFGLLFMLLLKGRLAESLRLGKTLSAAYRTYYHLVTEFLGGLKITKCFTAEERHVSAFRNAISEVTDSQLSSVKNQALSQCIQEVLSGLVIATFLWVSVGMLGMPIASVLVLALIFYRLLPMGQALHRDAQQLLHVAPAAETILSLSRACIAAREQSELPREVMMLERNMRFENVSFTQALNEVPTLSDVSFCLPRGTLTVLSGASGAGKSTLLDLAAGLLQPERGAVWIDGHRLTEESTRDWRGAIAYVLQDSFLFHDTIRQNLLVAKSDATEGEMMHALSLAGASKFIRQLPEGLETVVGHQGSRFSGGERQRIALARALLRKPSLLILDEATSSLDAESERTVLEGIEALKGEVTMILVTHRPERVRSPDQVLQLSDSRLHVVDRHLVA